MNKPIASRAVEDEWAKCRLCAAPPHIVVAGGLDCHYCANEVPLCRKHAAQLFDELLAIRNEDSAAATAKKKERQNARSQAKQREAGGAVAPLLPREV